MADFLKSAYEKTTGKSAGGGTGVFATGGSAQKVFEERYGSGSGTARRIYGGGSGGSSASRMSQAEVKQPTIVQEKTYEDYLKAQEVIMKEMPFELSEARVKSFVKSAATRGLTQSQFQKGLELITSDLAQSKIDYAYRNLDKAPSESSSAINRNIKALDNKLQQEAEKLTKVESAIKSSEQKIKQQLDKIEQDLAPYEQYKKSRTASDGSKEYYYEIPSSVPGNVGTRLSSILREANFSQLSQQVDSLNSKKEKLIEDSKSFSGQVEKRNDLALRLEKASVFESVKPVVNKKLVAAEEFGLVEPETKKTFGGRYTKYSAEAGYPEKGTIQDIFARTRAGSEQLAYELSLVGETGSRELVETGKTAKGAASIYLKSEEKRGDPLAPIALKAVQKVSPIAKPVAGAVGYGARIVSSLSGATGEVVGEAAFSVAPVKGLGETKIIGKDAQIFPKGVKLKIPTAEGILTSKPQKVKYSYYEVKPITLPELTVKQATKGAIALGAELAAYDFLLRPVGIAKSTIKTKLTEKYGEQVISKQITPGVLAIETETFATATSKVLLTKKPLAKTGLEKMLAEAVAQKAEVDLVTDISVIGKKETGARLIKLYEREGKSIFTTRKGAQRLIDTPKQVKSPYVPLISLSAKDIEKIGGTIVTATPKEIGKIKRLGEHRLKLSFPTELRVSSPEFSLISKGKVTPIKGMKKGKSTTFEAKAYQEAIVPKLPRFEESAVTKKGVTTTRFTLKSKQFESVSKTPFKLELIEDVKKKVKSPIYGIREVSPTGKRLLPTGKIQELKTLGKEITFVTDEPKIARVINYAALQKGKKTENVFEYFKRMDKLEKAKAAEKKVAIKKWNAKLARELKKQLPEIETKFKERSYGPPEIISPKKKIKFNQELEQLIQIQKPKDIDILPQRLFYSETPALFKASDAISKATKETLGLRNFVGLGVGKLGASRSKKLSDLGRSFGTKKIAQQKSIRDIGKATADLNRLSSREIESMKSSSLTKGISVEKAADVLKATQVAKASTLALQPTTKVISKSVARARDFASPISLSDFYVKEPIIPKGGLGLPDKDLEKALTKKVSGYHPYIKEKGKFFKASKEVFTKRGASAYAAEIADNSVAKTIKPIKAKKMVPKSELKDKEWKQLSKKFRKKNDVYIEKNKYGIDSVGELQGITAKGLLKIRQLRELGVPITGKKKSNVQFDVLKKGGKKPVVAF